MPKYCKGGPHSFLTSELGELHTTIALTFQKLQYHSHLFFKFFILFYTTVYNCVDVWKSYNYFFLLTWSVTTSCKQVVCSHGQFLNYASNGVKKDP